MARRVFSSVVVWDPANRRWEFLLSCSSLAEASYYVDFMIREAASERLSVQLGVVKTRSADRVVVDAAVAAAAPPPGGPVRGCVLFELH